MLKNWTVKTKQIKNKSDGLVKHFNYLKDKNRTSHHYTNIIDLNNSENKLQNILDEVENRQNLRRENGQRGGGVRNFATSFVLSLPRDIQQPTAQEWKKIAALTLKELADDLDIPFEKIKNNSVAILHDESSSNDKSSHVHFLVSNVIDGQVVKSISQYKATQAMKNGANKAVNKVLGVDHLQYTPRNENVGDKPLFVARNDKLDNKKAELIEDFTNMKNEIKQDRKELEEEKNKFKKVVNFAKKALKSWIIALRNNQQDELEKRAKQSAKVIVELEEKMPDVAEELTETARLEEEQAEALQELKDECKITHQVKQEKAKKQRKRRTRTRTNR